MTTHGLDEHFFESKFVVGCDGANSAVRQMHMIPFEGFTWTNFRFVAVDVEYDFVKHCGFGLANYVVHPEKWALIGKTSKANVRRVCYGEDPETSVDEESLQKRARSRISGYIDAANKDGKLEYNIKRLKPYWAHQKCAKSFRQGNVLLAGDAAHSNNSMGGLGLSSGILDAVVVGNALFRHLKNGETDELITKAVESRRQTRLTVANIKKKKRLFWTEEVDRLERDCFFAKLKENDEEFVESISSFNNLLPDPFEGL